MRLVTTLSPLIKQYQKKPKREIIHVLYNNEMSLDMDLNVSKYHILGLLKNEKYRWTPYYYPLLQSSDVVDHTLGYTTCDRTKAELDNWVYGPG